METQRDLLKRRREKHRQDLLQEMQRLTSAAAELGVQKVVLFGSVAQGKIGLASDLDLLIGWDTPAGFLERTVELYRVLQPRVAVDLLVYTPAEMKRLVRTPLVRHALKTGRVLYES
jgi:predicted nucleotidyltransferase